MVGCVNSKVQIPSEHFTVFRTNRSIHNWEPVSPRGLFSQDLPDVAKPYWPKQLRVKRWCPSTSYLAPTSLRSLGGWVPSGSGRCLQPLAKTRPALSSSMSWMPWLANDPKVVWKRLASYQNCLLFSAPIIYCVGGGKSPSVSRFFSNSANNPL